MASPNERIRAMMDMLRRAYYQQAESGFDSSNRWEQRQQEYASKSKQAENAPKPKWQGTLKRGINWSKFNWKPVDPRPYSLYTLKDYSRATDYELPSLFLVGRDDKTEEPIRLPDNICQLCGADYGILSRHGGEYLKHREGQKIIDYAIQNGLVNYPLEELVL